MTTCKPLVVAAILAVVINGYPFVMAFVVGSEAWQQGGWAVLFLTIPVGLGMLLVGGAMSLRRRLQLRGLPPSCQKTWCWEAP